MYVDKVQSGEKELKEIPRQRPGFGIVQQKEPSKLYPGTPITRNGKGGQIARRAIDAKDPDIATFNHKADKDDLSLVSTHVMV